MVTLSQAPGRTTLINGKEHLFFSGYSYLGLGLNKGFTDLVKNGIDLYGVVYPSSRISNTALDLYAKMEEQLAAFTLAEDAAVFSSAFAGLIITLSCSGVTLIDSNFLAIVY